MSELKNVIEDLVREKLDEYLEKRDDICKCKQCKLDILAIVLNNFPPKYIVTKKGEAYSRLNALSLQFNVDILTAIIQACEIVKRNPRH